MEETVNQKIRRETLLAYSEWLDGDQQLLEAPDGDERSHEDLVKQFLDEYDGHLPDLPGTFIEAGED